MLVQNVESQSLHQHYSACFGQAFLEAAYLQNMQKNLLRKWKQTEQKHTWLTQDGTEQEKRISIKDTRGIIDAILNGDILNAPTKKIPFFNFEVPTELPGVDTNILDPRDTYADAAELGDKSKRSCTEIC